MPRELVIVVPANGRGQRFRDRGVTTPKPLLRFCHAAAGYHTGQLTMVENALRGAPSATVRVGIPRHELHHWHDRVPRTWDLMPLPETDGQAHTLSLLLREVPPHWGVLVVNSDQGFPPNFLAALVQNGEKDSSAYSAAALTIRTEDYYSFSFVDGHPTFQSAAERSAVSEYALAGAYYFPRARDIKMALGQVLTGPRTFNGEYYLSQAFEYLPLPSRSWAIRSVPDGSALYSWGTPELLLADPRVTEGCRDVEALRRVFAMEDERNIVRSDS